MPTHDKNFSEVDEDEHLLACLLMVFVAVSVPKLACNDNSFFRASLEGHSNNIHCLAYAINHIFGALFTICNQGDIEDRMKELLAVSYIVFFDSSDKYINELNDV